MGNVSLTARKRKAAVRISVEVVTMIGLFYTHISTNQDNADGFRRSECS